MADMTDLSSAAHPTAEIYLYAYGEADAEQRARVEAHAACPTCRNMLEELQATRAALGALPIVDLPAERWEHMLRSVAGRLNAWRRARISRRRAILGLAAGLLLVAGTSAITLGIRRRETERLRAEVREARAIATIALLRAPRSAERLRGVTFGSALLSGDTRVSAAFAHALRYDPSPNVRLAVLDAIDIAPQRALLNDVILDALPNEPLPAVRLAMIELIARLDDPAARASLADVALADPDSTVRARARAAIEQLGRPR
jgi:hypothetical protein